MPLFKKNGICFFRKNRDPVTPKKTGSDFLRKIRSRLKNKNWILVDPDHPINRRERCDENAKPGSCLNFFQQDPISLKKTGSNFSGKIRIRFIRKTGNPAR